MATRNSTDTRATAKSHPRAQLTEHEIDLIRELIENGMTLRAIATKFEAMAKR